MTDLWLYTLDGSGNMTPLGDFADPVSKRKSRRLLMPCTLNGNPSGLVPCDMGNQNGVMTDAVSQTLQNGVYAPAITGVVEVPLNSPPTSPVLVVAAVEDERYYGAAAIDPAGNPVAVPDGVGVPDSHPVRTYSRDVAPIIASTCLQCHGPSGIASVHRLASYDDLVSRNIAFAESQQKCQQAFVSNGGAEQVCEQAINRVQFMIERGAPAASNLARRCRPDENMSVSPVGLQWYGNSSGSRFDQTGDRRMPSTDVNPDMGTLAQLPTYFDNNPQDYQVIFDWIAQGAPQ
jgi:hypothetical protein